MAHTWQHVLRSHTCANKITCVPNALDIAQVTMMMMMVIRYSTGGVGANRPLARRGSWRIRSPGSGVRGAGSLLWPSPLARIFVDVRCVVSAGRKRGTLICMPRVPVFHLKNFWCRLRPSPLLHPFPCPPRPSKPLVPVASVSFSFSSSPFLVFWGVDFVCWPTEPHEVALTAPSGVGFFK